jgi:hypothetical protein
MKHIKETLAILFTLSMTGCGSTRSVEIAIPSSNEQLFTFRDERPAELRISRNEISKAGATLYYADDNLSPPPAEMLRRTFINRASKILKGRTITLTEFDVHVTAPDVSPDASSVDATSHSAPNASRAETILAAPMIFGIESIRSYKAVTVEIRGRIDDVELYVYHSDEFRGRISEEDIRSVILTALDRAVTHVQRTVHE